jgi:hypothetical protein
MIRRRRCNVKRSNKSEIGNIRKRKYKGSIATTTTTAKVAVAARYRILLLATIEVAVSAVVAATRVATTKVAAAARYRIQLLTAMLLLTSVCIARRCWCLASCDRDRWRSITATPLSARRTLGRTSLPATKSEMLAQRNTMQKYLRAMRRRSRAAVLLPTTQYFCTAEHSKTKSALTK